MKKFSTSSDLQVGAHICKLTVMYNLKPEIVFHISYFVNDLLCLKII